MTDVCPRVLVTGATGIVGSEIVARLRFDGHCVAGTSRRGDEARDVVAWRMDADPIPATLRGEWDVLVHAAASTRWSMTPDEAWTANVATVEAVSAAVGPSTRLIVLSTAYVEGRRGMIESDDLVDYRNTYEWSKAAGERYVRDHHPDATILRFPIVVGRRRDGDIARFSGFYKLLGALASGLVPAIVALEDAYLDVIPVDDVADAVADLIDGGPPAGAPVILGRGADALQVSDVLDLFFDTLDGWRADRGIDALPRPPVLDPARWERFFLPFARDNLSPLQLRTLEVFSEFEPYMCITTPFATNRAIGDVRNALRASVLAWADARPGSASAVPEPWQ